MGNALAAAGRPQEAIKHYQKVLTIEPRSAEVDTSLAIILVACGRFAEAASHLRHAAELQPNAPDYQRNWAWLLATCPIATVRNGAEAVERAERANELCEGTRPDVLDALAAAYAEASRFPDAISAARQALELAQQQNNPLLAGLVRTASLSMKWESPSTSRPRRPLSQRRNDCGPGRNAAASSATQHNCRVGRV